MRRETRPNRGWGILVGLIAIVTCLSRPASGQDFRGGIAGTVSDNTGGALPGVTVTATNTATNVPSSTTTNESGNYTVPFLTPGSYIITVELQGFKKSERKNIDVRIGDRLQLDFTLEVGGIEETVTVASTVPLLETRTASAGQVIDEKRIALMPLSDGNPFVLSRLATGIAYTGDLKFSRPFDNGGTSSITADGAPGGNEFSLDGAPNMANGRRVAFTPPAGAVAEFKVETATFDAQQGHTAGATVNVTMKSGTNTLRGDGYYHYRDEKLSANDFFLERAGRPKDQLDYKRYGFNVGGPVRLGFYEGRDRTFFFSSVEWLYDKFPEPGSFTVPTEAQRNGDFSALLSQGIVIYDPNTARSVGGRVVRDPFPNNQIPASRISPIAREILKYYPVPNQSGDALGLNNYLSTNQRGDDFYSMNFRVDHVINDRQRAFVRYNRNNRVEYRGNWTGEINGIRPTGNYLYRINDAVNLDYVWTMGPSMLLNMRGGWSRFQEPSVRQHQNIFDPASLGFPASTTQYFGDNKYFPRVEMDDGTFADLGDTFAGGTNFSIYSFQPTATRIMGNHTMRAGYDFRIYREDSFPSVHSAGQYVYARGNVLTRQQDNSSAAVIGQDLAALLLGLPSGGLIDRSPDRFNQLVYHGLFFQDDWKLNDKLTVNLGLRWEYEQAPTERENRNIRGFDDAATLSITSAAQAAYARNPIPEIPASQFSVLGGMNFAGDGAPRGFYDADKGNIQPRVGLAYQWNPKTVVRAGWALYTVPALFDDVIRQSGYAQATNIVPTLDNGLTIQATLANPFPNGVQEPPGNSAGADTFLGRQLDRFTNDVSFVSAQAMRWAVSVQRELPGAWVFEAAYVGNRGYDLTTQIELNPVPNQYLSTSPVRDNTTNNYLTANVTNPFVGLLPGTGFNGATVQRQQLLRPYPHFANIQARTYDGASSYNSGQFRLEKRFSKGYTLLTTYTYSKFKERTARLNPGDTVYELRYSENDVPHRLIVNGIYELPFGRNRRWGSDANSAVNALIGDWSVSAWWNWQSGRQNYTFGNVYYDGDINQLKTDFSGDASQPMFDTSGFYFHDALVQTNGQDDPAKQRADTRIQLVNNLRTLPTRPANFRMPRYTNVDMSFVKGLDFGRIRAQIHFELYNAMNDVFYNNPNLDPRSSDFGKVTSQNNLPRNFQIGMKVLF